MRRQMQRREFEEEIFGTLTFRKFNVNGRTIYTATMANGRYIKFSARQLRSYNAMNVKFLEFMWLLIPHGSGSEYSELANAIVEHSIEEESQSPPKGWYSPPLYAPL